MKLQKLSIFLIFVVCRFEINAAQENDPVECKDKYCISGTMVVTKLVSSDNDFFKITKEGEDTMLSLPQGFDQEESERTTYVYLRTIGESRKAFSYAREWGSLCLILTFHGSEPDIWYRMLKLLFNQYDSCTTESKKFTVPKELKGTFGFDREPPSCDPFEALMFIGNNSQSIIKDAEITMYVKIIPDNALFCKREETTISGSISSEPTTTVTPGETQTEITSEPTTAETPVGTQTETTSDSTTAETPRGTQTETSSDSTTAATPGGTQTEMTSDPTTLATSDETSTETVTELTQSTTETNVESRSVAIEATTEPTAEATTEVTAEATTEPTGGDTTEPAAEATSEATAGDTTEPAAEATSEATSEATTGPRAGYTTEPAAGATSEATAGDTTEPAAEATSEATSEATTGPRAEITTEPATGETSEATAEATTEPTAGITTEPAAGETSEATAEVTTEPTVGSTTEPAIEASTEATAEATDETITESTAEGTTGGTAEAATTESEVETGSQPTTQREVITVEQEKCDCHYYTWLRNYDASYIPDVKDYYVWLTSNGCLYDSDFLANLAEKLTPNEKIVRCKPRSNPKKDCNYFTWLRNGTSSSIPRVYEYWDWLASRGCVYEKNFTESLIEENYGIPVKFVTVNKTGPAPIQSEPPNCGYFEWLKSYSMFEIPDISQYYEWLANSSCVYDKQYTAMLARKYVRGGEGLAEQQSRSKTETSGSSSESESGTTSNQESGDSNSTNNGNIFTRAVGSVTGGVSYVFGTVTGGISSAVGTVTGTVSSAVGKVTGGVSYVFGTITGTVSSIFGGIMGLFTGNSGSEGTS